MVKSKSASPPGTDVHRRHQEEYQKYLHLTESVLRDFQADVEELSAQESWSEDTREGVLAWVNDKDAIWRLLRRHRYDESKTHAALLVGLAKRISLGLHRRIPSIPPYSDSQLCYILPLPRYTDRVGRPVIVLTLKEVRRDEHGKMDDLKEWSWWALEMIRRTLRDYWANNTWDDLPHQGKGKARGKGGEGCVILVDANGAGYRNLEVEMLPTLLAVGHNHFPGIFDAVYVVNAGWTHRSMWGIIKRVLPKSALEKIIFLDKKVDIERVFDLDILPEDLGGNDPMTFQSLGNPILHHYSRPTNTHISHAITRTASSSSIADIHHTRSASSSSIADIYHTAENTPAQSRRQSMTITAGMGLHMSKAPPPLDPIETNLSRQTSRKSSSSPSSAGQGTLQRIKSLSDFHLYLSPSRLAHLDVLSDSDSDSDIDDQLPTVKRAMKLPGLESNGIGARRQRPPFQLQSLGRVGDEDARSYSDRLQAHHARILETYRESTMVEACSTPTAEAGPKAFSLDPNSASMAITERPSTPCSATTPGPPVQLSQIASEVDTCDNQIQPISAFRSDINPWYGYPAILTGTTLKPRYTRNRKRDLVKTLLFLFILRIQSWRDTFERFLGLNGLGTWGRADPTTKMDHTDPGQGLVNSSPGRDMRMTNSVDKDWIWMAVTFLLLRGTWARVLGGPLEAVGLGSVRGMLGLG